MSQNLIERIGVDSEVPGHSLPDYYIFQTNHAYGKFQIQLWTELNNFISLLMIILWLYHMYLESIHVNFLSYIIMTTTLKETKKVNKAQKIRSMNYLEHER